jgi:Flp pilus assembly protein TadG
MVEFALVFPLLVVLCMAAGDFGRLFFHGLAVVNATTTGTFHGARNNVTAAQFTTRENRALSDAADITGVTANATLFCDCPDGDDADSDADPVSCTLADNADACTGYGFPRVFAQTEVEQTFQTLGPWPGMPEYTKVARNMKMRVQ